MLNKLHNPNASLSQGFRHLTPEQVCPEPC